MLFVPSLSKLEKKILVKHAIAEIRNTGKADLIRFWAFPGNKINREEKVLLEECGFLFVKKGTGFVYLPLQDGVAKAEDIVLSRLYTQGNI